VVVVAIAACAVPAAAVVAAPASEHRRDLTAGWRERPHRSKAENATGALAQGGRHGDQIATKRYD
jgi:hypothetical protein